MATVATNPFGSYAASINAPAAGMALVSPSDTDELASVSRGIMIGAAGALHVTFVDGSEVTLPSGFLAVGVQYAMQIKQVHQSGTTATNIYVLY